MQTTCRIYQHHVGTVSLSRRQRIESHRGRVGTHLLLHHRHAYAFAPDAQLLYGSSTESISGTQIHLLAGLLELPSQLSDGGRLAHTIHTDYQYDIGLMIARQIPVIVIVRIVLRQQRSNLVTQDSVQLRCRHILIARHALLNAFDDFQRGLHTDVRGDEHLLQVIQHIVIHLRLASHSTCQLVEHTGLSLLQTFVQCFLFILVEKTKNSHTFFLLLRKGTKKS